MGVEPMRPGDWTGKVWLLAVIAVVLALLILLAIIPRPLAWTSPPPTAAPWTARPGLFAIPTMPLPTATPQP